MEKKRKNKFDIKNISAEDKQKFIFMGVVLLIAGGIFTYAITNSTDNNEEDIVEKIENPQADLQEYNSKLEALNPKDKGSEVNSLEQTFDNSSTEEETRVNEPSFSDLDRQIAGLNNPTSSNSIPQQSQPVSNSHQVYGDYNMWQTSEPSNSNIGYSGNKGGGYNRPKVVKASRATTYDVQEESYTSQTNSYTSPIVERKEQKVQQQVKQVSAQLISKGEIVEGRTLSFALKEPVEIDGQKLNKNFIIQGKAHFDGNRLMVNFNAIKVNGKLKFVNIRLFDENGYEGLGISGPTSGNSDGVIADVSNDVMNQTVGRIPIIGGAIAKNSKSQTSQQRSVTAQSAQVYLLIN